LPGHAPAPTAGRPKGAIGIITKSLREQILQGFDKRGISGFVEDLLTESPPSAAALLTRLLPPEANDEEGPGGVTSVTMTCIPRGHYLLPEDLGVSSFLYTGSEVAQVQEVQAQTRERGDALRRALLADTADDTPSNEEPDA